MQHKAKEGLIYEELTHKIIGAAMEVHRELGPGFIEKTYENALIIELKERGIPAQTQKKITVHYKNHLVGEHLIDILVDEKVILELKAVEEPGKAHEAQLISYLKAANIKIGLLINFSKESLDWKRIMLKDNLSVKH
ncbi:MAG: GxxExxY protein [Planctomycetes bacterium]|nr:GxxExxY protein [Planctomycetota bacterium]